MYAVSQKNPTIKPQNLAFLHGIQQAGWRGFLFGGLMKVCSAEGCEGKHWGRGYCLKHYARWRRHGNPLICKNKREKRDPICIISNCERKHFGRGYCKIHYQRWWKYGDPLINKRPQEQHGKHGTPEYITWDSMKNRCLNLGNIGYKNYGGRGITVCERWRNSFTAFYEDMGPKPFPKAQIDRIDNGGNYEPGNCRWTTAKINRRNSRQTKLTEEKADIIKKLYSSGRYTQTELGKKYNVHSRTINDILRGITWI